MAHLKKRLSKSGNGAVGRAVNSAPRDPQFESSHWQLLFIH